MRDQTPFSATYFIGLWNSFILSLEEAVGKWWIRVKGKAWGGSKAEGTRQFVSILNRTGTQPLTLRRLFCDGF